MITLEHSKYAVTISCPQVATLFLAFKVETDIVYKWKLCSHTVLYHI